MNLIAPLAISIISIPSLAALVWFIGKRIIDRWFEARGQAYEHELMIVSQRDNIRFSKLHEMRAQVMAKVYKRFVALQHDGMTHLSNGTQIEIAKVEALVSEIKSVLHEVLENRIYFTEDLSALMVKFLFEFHTLAQERLSDKMNLPNSDIMSKWLTHWLKLSKEIPDILDSIGDEFRTLLGVPVKPRNPFL
jgi:hypothetical protein